MGGGSSTAGVNEHISAVFDSVVCAGFPVCGTSSVRDAHLDHPLARFPPLPLHSLQTRRKRTGCGLPACGRLSSFEWDDTVTAAAVTPPPSPKHAGEACSIYNHHRNKGAVEEDRSRHLRTWVGLKHVRALTCRRAHLCSGATSPRGTFGLPLLPRELSSCLGRRACSMTLPDLAHRTAARHFAWTCEPRSWPNFVLTVPLPNRAVPRPETSMVVTRPLTL